MHAKVWKYHIWIPCGKIADTFFLFFFFLDRVISLFGVMSLWKKSRIKSCGQDISKSICARNMKLDQLIGDDDLIDFLTFR